MWTLDIPIFLPTGIQSLDTGQCVRGELTSLTSSSKPWLSQYVLSATT